MQYYQYFTLLEKNGMMEYCLPVACLPVGRVGRADRDEKS